MKNGNGTKSAITIVLFVGAILGSAITIYSVFHVPLVRAIEEEKEYRQEKDVELQRQLTEAIQEQQKTNEKTNVLLNVIATKLEYIQEKVRNN